LQVNIKEKSVHEICGRWEDNGRGLFEEEGAIFRLPHGRAPGWVFKQSDVSPGS
jgi:hypothetical protein